MILASAFVAPEPQPEPELFIATPEAERAAVAHALTNLPLSRTTHPPAEFRAELREFLLQHPRVRLADVARQLGVTRQRVGRLVGKLDRPNCAQAGGRPARLAAPKPPLPPRPPAHGTQARFDSGCACWRCRRAAGVAKPRGRRADQAKVAGVVDWLGWVDPDTGERLTQVEVGRLVGVGQPVVSRIARQQARQQLAE